MAQDIFDQMAGDWMKNLLRQPERLAPQGDPSFLDALRDPEYLAGMQETAGTYAGAAATGFKRGVPAYAVGGPGDIVELLFERAAGAGNPLAQRITGALPLTTETSKELFEESWLPSDLAERGFGGAAGAGNPLAKLFTSAVSYPRAAEDPSERLAEQIGEYGIAALPFLKVPDATEVAVRALSNVPGALGKVAAGARRTAEDLGEVAAETMARPRWETQWGHLGERKTRGRLSTDEKTVIGASDLSSAERNDVGAMVRRYRSKHSTADGWQPFRVVGTEITEKGTVKPVYKTDSVNYHKDKNGRAFFRGGPRAPERARKVSKMSGRMVDEVRELEASAAAGDAASQKIMEGINWYKGVRTKIRDAFGGAGDIYADISGATSANTNLLANVNYSNAATRAFLRGDFDEKLMKLRAHLEAGGNKTTFPTEDLILQANGKKFGQNSYNAMLAMLDEFRDIPVGSAPKIRQYGGVLIGLSDEPIVDVWAARTFQRLADGKRIAPVSESATQVSGKVNTDGTIGGAYGFGQDVFREAATELGMDASDLQAVMWMKEKHLWETNKWTPEIESNIIEMLSKLEPRRYQAGVAIAKEGRPYPSPREAQTAQRDMMRSLENNPAVLAARNPETRGMYMGDPERSFDAEWTTGPDFDPTDVISDMARVAKQFDQDDLFISRVITDSSEPNANARPGVEIYFREGKSKAATDAVAETIREMGVDGFTFIQDAKLRSGETMYSGVRVQYVPEIDVRWADEAKRDMMMDPDQLARIMTEAEDKMQGMLEKIMKREDILSARAYHYDTVVAGRENIDDYINDPTKAGESAPPSAKKVWFGQPSSEHVAGAVERIRRAKGTGSVAGGTSGNLPGDEGQILDELSRLKPEGVPE